MIEGSGVLPAVLPPSHIDGRFPRKILTGVFPPGRNKRRTRAEDFSQFHTWDETLAVGLDLRYLRWAEGRTTSRALSEELAPKAHICVITPSAWDDDGAQGAQVQAMQDLEAAADGPHAELRYGAAFLTAFARLCRDGGGENSVSSHEPSSPLCLHETLRARALPPA